ncbi:UDP-glucose 4-epimerase (EC [Olavius sp. associated proteobacterium Delta 1]|nr:UDP-glucose 4-epimerase (EC [Olavius sp. associated proteobacterium Delta 1]
MNKTNTSQTSILVTGGAGYIGAHACKALKGAGYLPVTYDNLVYGHPEAVKWGPLEEGDISNRQQLEMVMQTFKPAAVMHFAAYAYVGESAEDPAKYYRNNVAGTLSLLESMRTCGINKIIFSSTCATYGMPEQVPIAENHPQYPINPYGRSKLMIEWILQDFADAYGLKFVSLRYFNAAGADPDAEIGEEHNPETHLIPLALDAALEKSGPIRIFGSDYDTPDGTCIRDYIHVSDLAEAHMLALDYLLTTGESDVFNLGNGHGFSVRQVIEAAATVTGCEIPQVESGRRPGDPPILIGDSTKIQKILGWNPVLNQLETILETAWQWQKKIS